QQEKGDAGALTRAGLGHEHGSGMRPQRFGEMRENGLDRQLFRHQAAAPPACAPRAPPATRPARRRHSNEIVNATALNPNIDTSPNTSMTAPTTGGPEL